MARLSLSQGWTLTAESCGRGHKFESCRARGLARAECVREGRLLACEQRPPEFGFWVCCGIENDRVAIS